MTILSLEGDDVLFVHDGRQIRQSDNLRLKYGRLVRGPKPVSLSGRASDPLHPRSSLPHSYREIKGELQREIESRIAPFLIVLSAGLIFGVLVIAAAITLCTSMIHDATLLYFNMVWMLERAAQ
jgi:hypothetical protein